MTDFFMLSVLSKEKNLTVKTSDKGSFHILLIDISAYPFSSNVFCTVLYRSQLQDVTLSI